MKYQPGLYVECGTYCVLLKYADKKWYRAEAIGKCVVWTEEAEPAEDVCPVSHIIDTNANGTKQ